MNTVLERMRSLAKSEDTRRRIPRRVPVRLVKDALDREVDASGCLTGPEPAISADTLMRLSLDAPVRGEGSLDEWSVPGGCRAADHEVVCSSAFIELVLAHDESAEFSPTLLYVLGHEASHLALGHTRAYLSSPTRIAPGERLATALKVCSEQTETTRQETDADTLSLDVLRAELESRAQLDEKAFDGFHSIYSWLLWTPGQSATIERGASFCRYLESDDAPRIASYRDGHPRHAARAARIAKAIDMRQASYFDMNANIDEAVAQHFCDQARAYEAKQLDCATASPNPEPILLEDGKATLHHREPRATRVFAQPSGAPALPAADLQCSASPADCARLRTTLAECRAGAFSVCYELALAAAGAHDREAAQGLFHFACLRKHAPSCSELARLRANEQDLVSARKWAFRSCSLGSGSGCGAAARYQTALNTPRLFSLGVLEQGCRLGDAESCERAGEVRRISTELRATGLPFAIRPYASLPER